MIAGHQQLTEARHDLSEETDTPLRSSNENTIREDRLSSRRERDRLRRLRETNDERDARLKLSVLLPVSELSFLTYIYWPDSSLNTTELYSCTHSSTFSPEFHQGSKLLIQFTSKKQPADH